MNQETTNSVPPSSNQNSLTLIESKSIIFLSELIDLLQKKFPIIQSSNARIEGRCMVVDGSIRKNNITLKQIQAGIEFYREGWNKHRSLFPRR